MPTEQQKVFERAAMTGLNNDDARACGTYSYRYTYMHPLIGMRTLCWNNFGNNRMQKKSGIMLE